MVWDGGAGWGLAQGLLAFVFIAAIVAGIVLVLRAALGGRAAAASEKQPNHGASTQSQAMRLLEERYARGEIDRDEFLTRKGDLQS